MWTHSCAALVTGLAMSSSLACAQETYGNARFGFFVDIPAMFTTADPEPENGDGRSFHAADGSANLVVSGGWIMEENFAADVQRDKGDEKDAGWTLGYESKVTKSSASYSGRKGERIYYSRMITSCGGTAHAGYRLEYPAAQKAAYDPVIKSLNASLKAGVGNCG